jgi:hypothetical protein
MSMENNPNNAALPARIGPGQLVVAGVGSLVVLCLWLFPNYWYTGKGAIGQRVWLAERSTLEGWSGEEFPVAKSAEAVLVADRLVSYGFKRANGDAVLAFSAKRYDQHENDIGLFVHTPDRCWTESGWMLEPSMPDTIVVNVHGVMMTFERRIFNRNGYRELVYFGGLIGGVPCPFRLDHNMSVGMKHALREGHDKTSTTTRAIDTLFWRRVWDSFLSKSDLRGPKQFVRVSTPIRPSAPEAADPLLQQFLTLWLQPTDYDNELAAWTAEKPK